MKKSANAAMLSQTLDFPELLLPNTTLCARHDGLDVRKGGDDFYVREFLLPGQIHRRVPAGCVPTSVRQVHRRRLNVTDKSVIDDDPTSYMLG
jgi:hypothetical protein